MQMTGLVLPGELVLPVDRGQRCQVECLTPAVTSGLTEFQRHSADFVRLLARERRWTENQVVGLGRMDARGRLSHFILELQFRLSRGNEKVPDRFAFPLTQEHLADLLGLTPVHVNRTLQAMRAVQYIRLANRELTILDQVGLAETAPDDL